MAMDTWYLRTSDDTFGPESQARLLEWARCGRIQPGQEVSCDNVEWQRVEEVPFLDMRWGIDIGDGMPRGPFNRAAAESLLTSGRLPAGSKLVEMRESFAVEPPPVEPVAPTPPPPPPPPPPPEPEPRVVEKIVERVVEVEKVVPDPRTEAALTETQGKLADANSKLAATSSQLAQTSTQLQQTSSQLADAQARAEELSDEIARLPPNAQLAANIQSAVYELMQGEARELAEALEREERMADEDRQRHSERVRALMERRQQLLQHLGEDANDMVSRASRAHPEDARTVQLRYEYEDLKVRYEREQIETQQTLKDLNARVRAAESEAIRLRGQVNDSAYTMRIVQDLRERLATREKELLELRQSFAGEIEKLQLEKQALTARLGSQYGGNGSGELMDAATREARGIKLQPWMLKR